MKNPTSNLAIFDLDCTILNVDSEMLWTKFLFNKGIVSEDFVKRIERYDIDYERGELDVVAYEKSLLEPMVSEPFESLFKLRDSYLQEITRYIRPTMLERVNWHRAQNHTLLLATACNSFLAESIAVLLNFPHLICTQLDLTGEFFKVNFIEVPAFLDGKIYLLTKWLEKNHANLSNSWGYSDSYNDLALLNLVTHPVAVFPDARLHDQALRNHWEIIVS